MNKAKVHNLAIWPEPAMESEPVALRHWRSRPVAPARPSGLQSVPAKVKPKYRRPEFYLKIEGLTGPRDKSPVKGDRL